MTSNTDYKITTIGNFNDTTDEIEGINLFNFNDATVGVGLNWQPGNVNENTQILGDTINFPFNDLTSFHTTGLGAKNIVLQGLLTGEDTLENRGRLSSIVHDRKPKKLFLGTDWYYYVLGQDIVWTHDENSQTLRRYTASFNAYDPILYYAGGEGGDSPPSVNPKPVDHGTNGMDEITDLDNSASDTDDIVVDLRSLNTITSAGSTEILSKWYVYPFFWVIFNTGQDADKGQSMTITDGENHQLTFKLTENAVDGDVWVISPYVFRHQYEGYGLSTYPIYKLTGRAANDEEDCWFLDADIYDNALLEHAGSAVTRTIGDTTTAQPSATDRTASKRNNYPRAIPVCLDDINATAGVNTFTVTNVDFTDATNVQVVAQWIPTRTNI